LAVSELTPEQYQLESESLCRPTISPLFFRQPRCGVAENELPESSEPPRQVRKRVRVRTLQKRPGPDPAERRRTLLRPILVWCAYVVGTLVVTFFILRRWISAPPPMPE